MTALAHDTGTDGRGSTRRGSGLAFALVSAASFGLSGALARGLLDAGWTAGAAVAVRVLVAAVVLVVPALVVLRGRWWLLRRRLPLVVGYALVAVAGCQLFYFNAVEHLQVGVALLIEYAAPVAVVGWLWLRQAQRPSATTVAGAVVALLGLVLVLDLLAGATLDPVGVGWALAAMVCLAAYFVLSADSGDDGLPPLVLAAAGLLLGGLALVGAGLVGLVPMAASTADVAFAGRTAPWWLPVLALALVSAALSYTTGIEAVRRLGSRLASFVALTEVVFALVLSWLLLDELPTAIQFAGGALIVTGVVLVKLGETRLTHRS